MTLPDQILWGSGFLALCLLVHVICLAVGAGPLERLAQWLAHRRLIIRLSGILIASVTIIVVALTIQIWIWASAWISFGVFDDWNTATYFSLVTYTSLGYGDVVLEPGSRVFGVFAAVTGLLGFGISTAYLMAVLNRLLGRNR
ncbi:potassium channel family protein [Pukyongiella litopenaei]|uniref:Two pore domain potassium channel family protein n=1 Tax=Pukyongiella litopenaei TaxID=2605946 RepID=A0A2S0MU67_9RHOB|nr:ion channel [Pukyongiella litopenaei]AVO39425.1 two pore domain potassium channel family protein [Pukyongiella litopenaei]